MHVSMGFTLSCRAASCVTAAAAAAAAARLCRAWGPCQPLLPIHVAF